MWSDHQNNWHGFNKNMSEGNCWKRIKEGITHYLIILGKNGENEVTIVEQLLF